MQYNDDDKITKPGTESQQRNTEEIIDNFAKYENN